MLGILILTTTLCNLPPTSISIVGNLRITALSPTLVRIEPKAANATFEDRTTFTVVARDSFAGIPILSTKTAGDETTVTTASYIVTVTGDSSPPSPASMCASAQNGKDLVRASRIATCPEREASCLAPGASQQDCCGNCTSGVGCIAWIYDPKGKSCWLMASSGGTRHANDRIVGGQVGGDPGTGIAAMVMSADGKTVLWNVTDLGSVDQNVNWPAPGESAPPAYALKDYPRFHAPPWGPTPLPPDAEKIDPGMGSVATNGYDYTKNVDGDTYVWLLGNSIDEWHAARAEFVTLAGPTPALPDFAFGTWFTWWHQYTETESKAQILNWTSNDLPIDVWALDMNWRESPHGHSASFKDGQQHFYDYPNTELFPDFADPGVGWFDWLKGQKLRTYFNDHPFPVNGTAMQTSAEEVKFRWSGLTKWLSRGLTFWWFDANWAFSVPPPNVKYGGSGDGADWDGMSNRVWGSHLYYTTVEVYNKMNPTRAHTMPLDRPMVLTKYADGNMHPGLVQHQHPAQHRYPVWWTGDGVDLQASVQSMVDSGVYDFKPYVHSDCGGDYRGKVGGDLMRWAAHCAFGTIHRFHGSDHIPWSYDDHTTDVIRSYLKMRYALLPSLIAAGHSATFSGFPLVARCDVLYPTHAADGASSNEQYLFLNDTLVAPIWDSSKNLTSQSVWVPPGAWKDAWSGDVVTGPKMMTVQQPYERIPMWHRSGGLVVLADDRAALRVDDQDWSTLVLDAHAHGVDASSSSSTTTTTRVVRERGDATTAETPATTITMRLASNKLTFSISSADNGAERAWVLRVHLPVGRRVTRAIVDGREVAATHLAPLSVDDGTFTPFGGRGARPPVRSGHVAELQIPRSSSPRAIALEY